MDVTALGAIVSPPDAIAARAVLQRVHLPRRLSVLLEGESLFNDASGLVLFRFAIAAVATGSFSAVAGLESFILLAVGGLVVGGAIGAIWVLLVRRLGDDYLMIASSRTPEVPINLQGIWNEQVRPPWSSNYTINIKSKYNPQYHAGGDEGLIDGIFGSENWRKGDWQGYQGQDFEAIIDLQEVKKINIKNKV